MQKNSIISKVKKLADELARGLGYELVDVEYKTGNKHDLLSIYIYKKEGIDLDDCQKMSKSIDNQLEELDLIKNPYYLEISSPGLDRPLKTKDDYRRNLGNEIEVKLYAPINGVKIFDGILDNYDDEFIFLKKEEESNQIPIKSIALMTQKITF